MIRRPHPPYRRQWMTMVEIIVAMAILVVLMYVLSLYLHNTQVLWRETNNRSRMFEQARLVLDVITRDLQGVVLSDVPDRQINFYSGTFTDAPVTWTADPDCAMGPTLKFAVVTSNPLGLQTSDSAAAEVGYLWRGPTATNTPTARAKQYRLWRTMSTSSSGGAYNFAGQSASTWAAANSWDASDSAVLADGVYSILMTPYMIDPSGSSPSAIGLATDSMKGLLFVRVEMAMFDPILLTDTDATGNTLHENLAWHVDTFVKLVFVNR